MNKLLTKIVGVALGASMAIGVGVAVVANSKETTPVHAATSTLTIDVSYFNTTSYAANNGEHTTGTITWYSNQVMKNGSDMQWQKNNGYIYNKTDLGTIKSVTVTKSAGTFTTYYGTSEHPTSGTTVGGGYFTVKVGGATGKTTRIVVTYESGSSDTTTALSVSPNSWTGYDSQTINVSNYTVSCTSTKSPGYEFQGIGSGSGDNFVARVADFTSGCPTTADTRLQWKAKYPTTAGGSTYLYAYVSLTVTAESVNSIAISGSMTKTTYNQGDAWDPAGFTVKAYYASAPSTPVDVTNNAGLSWTYSPATTASTSTTSVTCTASFEGKSATSSAQSVTVNEKQNLGGIVSGEKYFIIATYGDTEYYLKSFSSTAAVSDSAVEWPGDSNMPATDDDAWTFTSTSTDDCWSVTNNDGDTLYSIVDNNGLRCGTSDHVWQLAEVNDALKMYNTAHVGAKGMYLTLYQGTNWRTYNSTSGQQEINSTIRFVKYTEPITLDSLTVSGATATFTAGDYFSLGSPTITAVYSDGSKSIAANDSGLSFKLGGNAITTSTRLTSSDNGKSLVVRYTDSENRYADATGYTLTVNPKPVQSVTLDKASATITKGGTVQLTATVSDEYAIQTVKWTTSNSSIATVSAATSTSGNAITVTGSSSNAGSATITAYVDENDNGSLDSGEKSATCTVTVSGDPVLNMLDDEENVISGESFHAFTTDSNIYLHVDAENFVGAITYTWSSSNTSAIAIEEEADEMCEFDIVGAGTNVRLSCHAVGATSGNLTTYVDYTVAEPQVDEVTWSAPATLSVYDNASLTAANITSWSPAYHKDNGESGSITSGYTVKLGGTTISLSHPWDIEDDGEELWIEYGGIASSHVTVQVTEHLNTISYSSWSKVTDVSDLKAGDAIVIAEGSKGSAMSKNALKSGETLESLPSTIVDGEISDLPSDAAKLTLGGTSGSWTLQNESGEYLSITSANTRHLQFVENAVTLSISISDGDATIGVGSTRILLNSSLSPYRYSTYQSATSSSMLLPEIYKSTTSNIADTNATAQRALISFAKTFNTTMACDDGGATENVESKWSTLAVTFTNTMNGLESDDKTVFKRLVANASAVEGGDSLQDMLARYDYIIAKYKLSNDFLHDGADRGAVQYAHVNPLINVAGKGNTAAIVVVTSMLGLAAVGGYFFMRKRKEQ